MFRCFVTDRTTGVACSCERSSRAFTDTCSRFLPLIVSSFRFAAIYEDVDRIWPYLRLVQRLLLYRPFLAMTVCSNMSL